MGAVPKPVVVTLMVAILAMPLLAASHCLEAISGTADSAVQLGVTTSEHDDCESAERAVQSATGAQPRFQAEATARLSGTIRSSDNQAAPMLNDGHTPRFFQSDLGTGLPRPSKQSLNCTLLI